VGKNDLTSNGKPSSKNKSANLGNNLIFIFSQPRAGSTLLQRILGAHPDIHTTAEPWIMLHPLYALKKEGIYSEYGSDTALQGLYDFLNQTEEKEELYYNALRKMVSTLYDGILSSTNKTIFLDKTPRYYNIIPELYRLLPEAKFVFLFRNPLAVLSSTLASWYNNNHELLLKSINKHDIFKAPAKLLEGITLLKEKGIIIHYEKLVLEPHTEIQKLCDKLDIKYYDDMINYGKKGAPKGRFGDAIEIHRHSKPVDNSIEKWILNLTTNERLKKFTLDYLSFLGPLTVSEMGYSYEEIQENLQRTVPIAEKRKMLEAQILGNTDNKTPDMDQFVELVTRLVEQNDNHYAIEIYDKYRSAYGQSKEMETFDSLMATARKRQQTNSA
jgi:hypothetical protein